MFDIVSGRETRAAVLLAGLTLGFARSAHNDIDGLRFSMESQFYVPPGVSRDLCERASRQERKCFAATSRNSVMFRRSQTST